ncbi:MAG TPA: hypothetical protein VK585_00455, partial [Jiangellaceae bacterium]|nr:hypothetical protein [Jiangellaceae bacterium]
MVPTIRDGLPVFKSAMSYDFAVLTRQAAGSDDASAITAAISVFEGETSTGKRPDSRLMALLADLEAIGAGDEDEGWISVWPLTASAEGVALPTTYPNVDDNIVVLLRLAARYGLVLVDLNADNSGANGPFDTGVVRTGPYARRSAGARPRHPQNDVGALRRAALVTPDVAFELARWP